MIIKFKTRELEKLYTRWIHPKYGTYTIYGYIKKIAILKNARDERDVRVVKSLHFEKLNNYQWGMYSIKINEQRRIVLDIKTENGIKVILIKELSNHYQ